MAGQMRTLRQTDGWSDTDRQVVRHRQMVRHQQTDEWSDTQTDGQRQMNGQTHTHTHSWSDTDRRTVELTKASVKRLKAPWVLRLYT